MVVGLDGAGKSTVADLIEGEPSDHRHREDLYYRSRVLEVPGRYIENHWMHNTILMLAQNQAAAALFLIDGDTLESFYSSGYARAFTIPCLGVLTKCAHLTPEERARGMERLVDAGCSEALVVSTETGQGVRELLAWIDGHAMTRMDASGHRKEEPCAM